MVILSSVIRPLASQLHRHLVKHTKSHRITPVRRCNLIACSSKYVLSQSKYQWKKCTHTCSSHNVSSFYRVDAAVSYHNSFIRKWFSLRHYRPLWQRVYYGTLHVLVFIVAVKPFIVGHTASVYGDFCCHPKKRAGRELESLDWSFPISGFGSNTPLLTQLCLRLISGSRFSNPWSISDHSPI